jgi:uncharacterized protein YqjF (DUF2071 family)
LRRLLSGLPYIKTSIQFQTKSNAHSYSSINTNKGFHLGANFTIGERIPGKSVLDNWLTELYCLYLEKDKKVFRYQTHHKPWDLNAVKISNLKTNYTIGNISLDKKPDIAHFSKGVKVVAWSREYLSP